MASVCFKKDSLRKQTFLLAHRRWGTFREEERLRFHTDDVKSVWNLVVGADWTSE